MKPYRLLALGALCLAACSEDNTPTAPSTSPSLLGASATGSAVYTMTNDAQSNTVYRYQRQDDGTLDPPMIFATGGRGTGDDAIGGNQGAVTLSPNGRWLAVVNPGSNEVSLFKVTSSGLTLTDHESSGGTKPISVTIHGRLVYVLNSANGGNISGLRFDESGNLTPIAGSTQPLSSAAAGPAQIGFNPGGDRLVVTEKATNRLSGYSVSATGIASGPTVTNSAGVTPFGFAFSSAGVLVVSEAFGGAPGGSAVSSYTVSGTTLNSVTESLGADQTAACWVAITSDGSTAFVTNTGSGTVSSFGIDGSGKLSLLVANAPTGATSTPIDAALSGDDRFLYVLEHGSDAISIFAVGSNGSLTSIGQVAAPGHANGLAAQ